MAAASQPPRGRPNLIAMQANREEKIRKYKQAKEVEEKLGALGTWDEIRKRDDDVQVSWRQNNPSDIPDYDVNVVRVCSQGNFSAGC